MRARARLTVRATYAYMHGCNMADLPVHLVCACKHICTRRAELSISLYLYVGLVSAMHYRFMLCSTGLVSIVCVHTDVCVYMAACLELFFFSF